MAIRTILHEGDPALRRKSRPLADFDERLKTLAADMLETMRAANGVGLAAPQVGVLRRLFVMDVGDGEIVAVNPELRDAAGEQVELEGCLSLPGLYGRVARPEQLTLCAQNLEGEAFELELSGLAAICAAHETDHLDGILFRDRAIGELISAEAVDDDE